MRCSRPQRRCLRVAQEDLYDAQRTVRLVTESCAFRRLPLPLRPTYDTHKDSNPLHPLWIALRLFYDLVMSHVPSITKTENTSLLFRFHSSDGLPCSALGKLSNPSPHHRPGLLLLFFCLGRVPHIASVSYHTFSCSASVHSTMGDDLACL